MQGVGIPLLASWSPLETTEAYQRATPANPRADRRRWRLPCLIR
jgi:hypothetical protein